MISIKINAPLKPEITHTIHLNAVQNRIHKWRHGEVIQLVCADGGRQKAAVTGWSGIPATTADGPSTFAMYLYVLPLMEDYDHAPNA